MGLLWLAGTTLTALFAVFSSYAMSDRMPYVLSLPDSVFKNGAIDHAAIQRIQQTKRVRESRFERKAYDIKKKCEFELEQLRKEYRALSNEFE